MAFSHRNGVAKVQVNQIEVNLWHQRLIDGTYHEKLDIQMEARASFAEGRLDLFKNETLSKIGAQ